MILQQREKIMWMQNLNTSIALSKNKKQSFQIEQSSENNTLKPDIHRLKWDWASGVSQIHNKAGIWARIYDSELQKESILKLQHGCWLINESGCKQAYECFWVSPSRKWSSQP